MLPMTLRAFSPVRAILGTGGLAAAGCSYDVGWNGVSKTGTAVNSWADFRGSAAPASASTQTPVGTGSAPTQAATPRSPVVVASGNKALQGANTTTLDSTGNGSVFVVGLSPTASGTLAGVSGNVSDLAIGTTSGGHYASILGKTGVAIDSGVADDSSTPRALFATLNGAAGQMDVGNHAVQSQGSISNGSNAAGPNFWLQGFSTTTTCSQWFGYYSTAIWTSVQFAFLTLFGMRRFGAVAAA